MKIKNYFVFIIVILLLFTFSCSKKNLQNEDKYIPGISAVDLHGNLTNKGFKLEKKLDPKMCYWKCSYHTNEYEYIATAYGDSPTKIYKIEAVVLNYSNKNISSIAKDFLGYIATIPYDGSKPLEAKKWVITNINKNSKKSFGKVEYQIVKSNKSIILTLEPIKK